jgi:hypothetical protein
MASRQKIRCDGWVAAPRSDIILLHPYSPVIYCISAGNLKQSMEARNRVGIGFVVPARQATHSLAESIPGLLKSFKIPPQYKYCMNRQVFPIGYKNGIKI